MQAQLGRRSAELPPSGWWSRLTLRSTRVASSCWPSMTRSASTVDVRRAQHVLPDEARHQTTPAWSCRCSDGCRAERPLAVHGTRRTRLRGAMRSPRSATSACHTGPPGPAPRRRAPGPPGRWHAALTRTGWPPGLTRPLSPHRQPHARFAARPGQQTSARCDVLASSGAPSRAPRAPRRKAGDGHSPRWCAPVTCAPPRRASAAESRSGGAPWDRPARHTRPSSPWRSLTPPRRRSASATPLREGDTDRRASVRRPQAQEGAARVATGDDERETLGPRARTASLWVRRTQLTAAQLTAAWRTARSSRRWQPGRQLRRSPCP